MKTRTASAAASRSASPGHRTPLRLTAVSLALLQIAMLTPSVGWAATPAGITAANGNTGVATAPNGVPVVNIAAPNASGVSHNQYNQFNVDTRGAVLNNGDLSQVSRNSQLAGQVYANPNLRSQASVIINEVVSPNRSQLNGYVEVLGGKADVVIANPFGITCNGCGFINTDRASLTTGTPVFNGAGGLTGFNVTGGDVLVNGLGLDGKAQNYFDIVARSVKLDGQVNANDLNITTGAGNWNYTTRTGSAAATSGTAPDYAFDSTALGGMYANRIKIVANEAGVGVRVLGDVAATGSDFTIDAAGKIQLGSRISAQGNLRATSSGTGVEVSGTGSSLAAHGDIALSGADITLATAPITADGDLNVNAGTLNDSTTPGATRFAGKDTRLNVSGAANISGTTWGAGGKLTLNTGTLALGSGTALYSGSDTAAADRTLSVTVASGNLDLGTNSVKSSGNVALASSNGSISVASGGAGVEAGGNLGVTAHTGLNNSGQLLARNNLTVDAATISNTGTLEGANTTSLTAHTGLTNDTGGKIVSGNSLLIDGANLVNKARIQSANGATIVASSLQNQGSDAVILTSTTGSGSGAITVGGALSNDGAIHGNGALTITAGRIANNATGGISTAGTSDLSLASRTGAISNDGAIYAGGKLSINTQNGASNYDFTNGRTGTIGGTDIDFKTGNLTNYNEVIATHNIDVDAKGNFTNTASTNEGLPVVTNEEYYPTGARPSPGGATTVNVFVKAVSYGSQANVSYSYSEYWRDKVSGTGLQGAKLIAGNAINLKMTGTGSNYGSLISAPTVQIDLLNGGVFNNQSIDLVDKVSNKVWMSDITDGDWDLYIPSTLAQYNLLFNATDSQLYALAESGSLPCNCYAGGIGGYPTSINERVGQQTSIWAHILTSQEATWTAARDSAYAKITETKTTAASAQIKAGTFSMPHGTLSNSESPYTPDSRTPAAPGAVTPTSGLTPGLDITLPSNPNGNFVIDRDPHSKYLIETNPLYGTGSYLGSDYLFNLLGYDPDQLQKRLGDGNYEAKLIRDQLIAQTGRNILTAYNTEAQQMQALLDSAYAQSHDLGLQLGVPLTAAQTANLKSDLVWMVEQNVNGQTVLAPVIYLASATRNSVVTGAVVEAKNIMLTGDGLKNSGSIIASDRLAVTTTGDIVNTSGTIKGGTIALKSTEGSVKNETFVQAPPADGSTSGVIGKQGSIAATEKLSVDAKDDIVITGAKLTSGGDMKLNAGRDITAKTLVNDDTNAQRAPDGGLSKASIEAKNLAVDAGRDVVVAGGSVKATDNASITAKRDVTLDTVQQKSIGMTGGNTDDGTHDHTMVTSTITEKTHQIGSTLDVGNKLTIKSGNDVTVAGSQVNVGGNADIDAKKNLNIVDRQDTAVATTITKTHSLDSGMSGVSVTDSTTTTVSTTKTSVGSAIKVGGNGKLTAGKTLTVKGSDVATGGKLDLKAESIKVLAGENSVDTVSHTETKSQGMSMSANANGSGIGYNNSKTTTDVKDSSSTARVSTLTSGGNMTRTATDKITDQGTQITTGGDFTQKAKTIEMLAAENKQSSNTTSHTDSNSVGISVQYGLGTAYNDLKKGSAAGAVSASGGPTVGIDYGHQTKDSNSSGNGTQAVVTTVKSGGKITSISTQDTRLEGADLSSKGDTTISARKLTVDAAHDTTSSSNSSSQTDVGARLSVDMSGKPGAEVSASHSDSNDNSKSSTAVVGKINAGGNLKITTSGDTNLEGTQVGAKGDTTISAGGNVNVTAAKNTADSDKSNYTTGGTVGASKDAGSGSFNYSNGSEDSKSTTAVTGSITAGNNVTIKSGKDIKLEGTDITSGKDAALDARGKIDVKAATSTTESSKSSLDVSAAAQGSKGQGGTKHDGTNMGAGAVSGSGSDSSSTTQKVSNITTGGNLKMKSGSTTTLEGTQADVGGKATISAGGGIVTKDVVSSSKDSSKAGGISVAGGKGAAIGGGGMKNNSHSSTSTTSVNIKQNQKAVRAAKASSSAGGK